MTDYFTEREEGRRSRTVETIPEAAWAGIKAEIRARINDGSFGASYPETCQEGSACIGTDEQAFWNAIRGRNPSLEERPWNQIADQPPLGVIMDLIEFGWRKIGLPIQLGYHPYFRHSHFRFDIETGRVEFRETINEIFRRNGLVYEFKDDGRVQRLAPPILQEALTEAIFATGDVVLDGMLETARTKFFDRDEQVRREALEKLWDAFERIKTLGSGSDKRDQTRRLLDSVAESSSSKLREKLESESLELTRIGNNFYIRHSELEQERVPFSHHVDYLFHRMFAFIILMLRGRLSSGG